MPTNIALDETSLESLQAGEQVQLSVGDTLRVTVGFKYTVAEKTMVTLQACPYQRVLGVLDRIGGSCGQANIELERAATPKLTEAAVDMLIVPEAQGGVEDGTYGLIVEILGTDAETHIDDILVISGNPPSPFEMIPSLIMVMMMGMMIDVMEGV